jgi:phosphinothricin acetyltransferase
VGGAVRLRRGARVAVPRRGGEGRGSIAADRARGRPSGTERDGRVVGYAYAGPWEERAAYCHTVENAIHLEPGATGRGIGTILLNALLTACAKVGVRQVIAVIADSGDRASTRLHARCGFREIGCLQRVGFKHGRFVDTVLMQRALAIE